MAAPIKTGGRTMNEKITPEQLKVSRSQAVRQAVSDGWIERWMAPLYGVARGGAERILAPDLDGAFRLARAMWPGADGWTCIGPVHPTDSERVVL